MEKIISQNNVPLLTKSEIKKIFDMDTNDRISYIIVKFFPELNKNFISETISQTFKEFEFNTPTVTVCIDETEFALELFHGKSLFYSDIAFSLLPRICNEAIKNNKSNDFEKYVICGNSDFCLSATTYLYNEKLTIFCCEEDISTPALSIIRQNDNPLHSIFYTKNPIDKLHLKDKKICYIDKYSPILRVVTTACIISSLCDIITDEEKISLSICSKFDEIVEACILAKKMNFSIAKIYTDKANFNQPIFSNECVYTDTCDKESALDTIAEYFDDCGYLFDLHSAKSAYVFNNADDSFSFNTSILHIVPSHYYKTPVEVNVAITEKKITDIYTSIEKIFYETGEEIYSQLKKLKGFKPLPLKFTELNEIKNLI